MSAPLLLARKAEGKGPKVPIRGPLNSVVVEGLADGDGVVIEYGDYTIRCNRNGCHALPVATEKGQIARAELIGSSSCAYVRLDNG